MEVLVERMREKITVSEVVRNDITNAFRISFKGADAKVTQAVTAELAGKYVSGQTSAASNEAEQTKRFFEEQLTEAKAKLDAIEAQRLQYMRANIGNLPSENGALLGQLNTLSERQTSLVTEISRMRDQRNLMTGQLNDLRQQYQREQDDIVERVGDPKASAVTCNWCKPKHALKPNSKIC